MKSVDLNQKASYALKNRQNRLPVPTKLAGVAFALMGFFLLSLPILLFLNRDELERSWFFGVYAVLFWILPFAYLLHWGAFWEMKSGLKWIARVLLILVDVLVVFAGVSAMF